MELLNDHYDSPWKEAIEQYFPEFMTFYFPDAYGGIDWTKEHVFLDQELRAVVQDAERIWVGSWQWASLPIGEFDFGINKDGLCLLCFVA